MLKKRSGYNAGCNLVIHNIYIFERLQVNTSLVSLASSAISAYWPSITAAITVKPRQIETQYKIYWFLMDTSILGMVGVWNEFTFPEVFCEKTKINLMLLVYFFHYSRPMQVIHPYSNNVESKMAPQIWNCRGICTPLKNSRTSKYEAPNYIAHASKDPNLCYTQMFQATVS